MKYIFACLGLLPLTALSQETPRNWHFESHEESGRHGIDWQGAMALLEGAQPDTIIVAVLDSGIDTTHADLKGQLWVNADEVPNNGIDDDNNGYVDDIHGWNFLGGPNGNIEGETLEMTRLYRKYKPLWNPAVADSVRNADPELWSFMQGLRKDYLQENGEYRMEGKMIQGLMDQIGPHYQTVANALGEDFSMADLEDLPDTLDASVEKSANILIQLEEQGLSFKELEEYKEHIDDYVNYHLNLDWYIRDSIIGDDPNNWADSIYGNTDLMGKSSDHGTHVAGIIGSAWNDSLGNRGVAPFVKIMVLRVVPNGDEYDKDVGLAIRYAVRNGAKVLNMSFGKSYATDPEKVREIAQWAQENDVVLVHAAGNESMDIDINKHYPHLTFETDNSENVAWIEVGASSYRERLAAGFSNYGAHTVDVFAPGEDIYSTLPVNSRGFNSGTSMASPVVAGMAGFLRAYFPELTAAEIKSIIVESSVRPESDELSDLAISGGIVNLKRAVELALEKTEAQVETE